MDDCRCPSTTCACDDERDRYVVDAWHQHDQDVTPLSRLRVVHGHDENPGRTLPPRPAPGPGVAHHPHNPCGVRRPPTNPEHPEAA